MRRGGRRSQRGAESLEFVALLPLLLLVGAIVWQGIVLVSQEAEANADARTLVRQAVICGTDPPPALTTLDPAARGGSAELTTALTWVTATVTLAPQSVLPHVDLRSVGFPAPRAEVTMRHEPC